MLYVPMEGFIRFKSLLGKFLPTNYNQERSHTPLKVHSGDIEDHSLQPQDHEETLRKWTVADTLSITARLKEKEKYVILT